MPPYRTMCPCGCGQMSHSGFFVAGHRPISHRFWAKVNRTDTCWLWTGAATAVGGYGRIVVEGKPVQADHVAWTMAGGTIPDGLWMLHTCDVRACVRNDDLGTYTVRGVEYERRGHLFLATHSVNMDDMALKGRAATTHPEGLPPMPGEANPRAILTESDVREIRRIAATRKRVYSELARQYGVSHVQIRNVVVRKSWRHI